MPQVLILGGGYAGVAAARAAVAVTDAHWTITLVDRRPAHELLTRLPEIVAGSIEPSRALLPYREILPPRVRLVRGEVEAVDFEHRMVKIDGTELGADGLIVAMGVSPGTHGVPGAELAYPVRSVGDAARLRARLLALRGVRSALSVVVVGAGYTGVEVAGELLSDPEFGPVTLVLTALDDRLLPQGNRRLAAVARRVLAEKGAHFRLGEVVSAVLESGVELLSGDRLPADLVVWAAPSVGPSHLWGAPERLGQDGRVDTDPYLRLPRRSGVYVAGDLARVFDYVNGAPAPASAQLAVPAGVTAARNLLGELTGGRQLEFRPRIIGEALSLGGSDGAAEAFGFLSTGRAALLVKNAALARYLAGLGGARLLESYLGGHGRVRTKVPKSAL